MSYIKELLDKIEVHEAKDERMIAEVDLLKNELEDVLSPNLLLLEQTQLILQMLTEYLDFVKKRGESAINRRSKERLVRLLEINSKLSGIGDQNATLKILNEKMYGRHNNLVDRFLLLQAEINKVKNAENF